MSAAQSGPAPRETRVARATRVAERLAPSVRLTLAPRPLRRAPRVPFVALVVSLLLTGVVGLLLVNTSMQQSSFTASALTERAAALEARGQTLRMEIEELRDPQRVAREARRLGMVAAGSPAFLDLSDGSVLGDPQVATAENPLRIEPPRTEVPQDLRPERIVVVDRSLLDRDGNRGRGRGTGTTEAEDEAASTTAGEGQDTDE